MMMARIAWNAPVDLTKHYADLALAKLAKAEAKAAKDSAAEAKIDEQIAQHNAKIAGAKNG